MRVHTDVLTTVDFYAAMKRLQDAYPKAGSLFIAELGRHGSRTRERAFSLGLAGTAIPGRRRRRNWANHKGDADGTVAATWDEWGMYLRELFLLDPKAVAGQYDGATGFHKATVGRFLPHDWDLEHSLDCTGCVWRRSET